jgi:Cu/Ag efflux protein CusF
VAGENVEGWMGPMTMSYAVDKDAVLAKVKAADQITAKVYDGDFKTLHEVQVVPPKTTTPPSKK